jgi:hypothetical protein
MKNDEVYELSDELSFQCIAIDCKLVNLGGVRWNFVKGSGFSSIKSEGCLLSRGFGIGFNIRGGG